MSTGTKERVVALVLVALTLWPFAHTQLVRRHGINPWKLGGWAMYSVPPIAPAGMEVVGETAAGDEESLSPTAALRDAGAALLDRHRWLGGLAGSDAFAAAVFDAMPRWTTLRIVIFQPVLRRATGMIEMTEVVHAHARDDAAPARIAATGTGGDDAVGMSEAPPPPRFIDNGDGTGTDLETGLMWELKIDGLGCGHCVEDKHTWSASGEAPDGTVFTAFLASLNERCDGDEKTLCTDDAACVGIGNERCGHAGYRDWRLPTDLELRALLLEPYECSVDPCIDPSFPGKLKASAYWTSTPSDSSNAKARGVFFNNGFVGSGFKTGKAFARAVRAPPR